MKIKHVGSILLGRAMLALLLTGMVLVKQFNRPMGPSLALAAPNAPDSAPAETIQKSSADQAAQAPQAAPAAAAQATATQASAKFCGNTGAMTILVIGSDADPNLPPLGADLVRYVKVDFDQQKVVVFTFPRSLWLNTKPLAEQNIQATTLGETYHFQYTAAQQKAASTDEQKLVVSASQAVAQTIYDNFGLQPDHYVTVKLSNLPKMIDTIGGVAIDNPQRLVAQYIPPVTFPAGKQTLSGIQASSYVRWVDATHSDWDRIARQNLVLDALRAQMLTPNTLTKLPDLFTQLADAIVTDLSPENVTDLTCVMKSLPKDKIVQEKIPPEMVSTGPSGSMKPDMTKIQELLKTLEMVP
jgi:LCP family protein required for cell wall assembly